MEFGQFVWCPRCKGKGTVPPPPGKDKRETCRKCKGEGIVPNVGPIAPPRKL
jgi:DnaJ-class molecular chaperone